MLNRIFLDANSRVHWKGAAVETGTSKEPLDKAVFHCHSDREQ